MAKYTGRKRFNSRPPEETGTLSWIIKGVFVSLIISFGCAVFLSLISLITDNIYIDRYMQYLIVAITMVSIFIGSVYASKCAKCKGLIIGGSIGIIYVLVSASFGMELNQDSVSVLMLVNKFVAGIAAGILGGLIGVNL